MTLQLKALHNRLGKVMTRNAELFEELEELKRDQLGADYAGQEPDDFEDEHSRSLQHG